MKGIITAYFSSIFSSNGANPNGFKDSMVVQVSYEQNELLLSPISQEEVHKAVFNVHSDKAPRPDGLNPTFFKKIWLTVGSDIVRWC